MRSFKFFICLLLIFSLTFFTFSTCFANESSYIWSSMFDTDSAEVSASVTSNSENTNSLSLESESVILIEQTTGKILYSKNEHEQLRPASVTKVMSILLIMESIDSGKIALTDSVPCSENAASMGGSQIWLDPRETLTVDEMLKAICVRIGK